MKTLEELKEQVKDEIFNQIPINAHCPYCDKDIDLECLIDPGAKFDKEQWDRMALNVIGIVMNHVKEMLEVKTGKL